MEIAMRGRPLILVAVVAALFTAGGAPAQHAPMAAPPSEASFAAHAAPLKFELFRGTRIFFKGMVNGHPADVMLDSGAATTVIDTGFAARIGLSGGQAITMRGQSGTQAATVVPDVSFGAGPLSLKSQVVLLDLAPVTRGIGRQIDMVLGRQAFEAGIVDIDFEKGELHFRPRDGFAAPSGATRLPLTRAGGIRQIPISIGNRAPILADFDLGHGGSMLLARPDWQNDPELSGLRTAVTQAGGVGGVSEKRLAVLPSVTVGGHKFEQVPSLLNLRDTELPTHGANIGIELLRRFRIALDFTGDTLWLTPVASAMAEPLSKDRLGMRAEMDGDALKVVYVSPGSPAAAAGLKPGDRITAVGDVKVGPGFYTSRYASFGRLAAGTRLDLARADGSRAAVVLADYF
jgi:hypothetical protein